MSQEIDGVKKSFFKSWKFKILFPIVLATLLVGTGYILWSFPISSGKRVGNLTKLSKKGRFWFTKTWEGTLDEGSGDQLTHLFSVKDEKIAQEMYNYEGRQVVIYYEQYILGWPRSTNYVVVAWKPKEDIQETIKANLLNVDEKLVQLMGQTLFCTLLGTIFEDQDLYQKVKEMVKQKNLYLYKQYDKCNE